jgi:putative Mg2+ transporter-C (MgtC) family protein
MLDEILVTLQDEFADLADPAQLARSVFRIMLAVLLSGVVGYERELAGSTAGLRTHMLVALGVTLFVLGAEHAGFDSADMSRVLQGVVAGIGFLGAGAILKHTGKDEVRGLTTAASIWATAAIAAAVGLGHGATAVFATAVVYVILGVLRRIEPRFERRDPPDSAPGDSTGR